MIRKTQEYKRREFPDAPILCVGAVIIDDGAVALVRRKNDPQKGEWTIPGGRVELGERVLAAVCREVLEETGLHVEPLELAAVFERIVKKAKRVQYHYVVLDYVCLRTGGQLRANSDVSAARWAKETDFLKYHLRAETRRVIRKGYRILASYCP